MPRRGLGYACIGVGLFMGLGILMNVGQGHGAAAYVFALLFCTLLPCSVGVALLRRPSAARLAVEAQRAWESELLRLAERRGGNLTVAEVVAHADLASDAAERHLENFCLKGVAEHRVSETGVIVYRFVALVSEDEKRRAKGLLDD